MIFLMMIGFGFFYLLGFAMSFDAPGSDKDSAAWAMRLLMFLPGLILLAALIFAFISYRAGNFKMSVIVSTVPLGMCAIFILYLFITSFTAMTNITTTRIAEAADKKLYPVQTYLRPLADGADTIIVFPNRIVSYRLMSYNGYPYAGPLGDMNENRTTIVYNNSSDTKLPFEELDQFVDATGKKITEVYQLHK